MFRADPRQNESGAECWPKLSHKHFGQYFLSVRSEFHSIEEKGQLLTFWINWHLSRNGVQTATTLHLINKSLKKLIKESSVCFRIFAETNKKRFIIWHKTSVWMTNKTKLSILKIVSILHVTYFTIKLFLCTFIIKCQNISV